MDCVDEYPSGEVRFGNRLPEQCHQVVDGGGLVVRDASVECPPGGYLTTDDEEGHLVVQQRLLEVEQGWDDRQREEHDVERRHSP